MKKKEYILPSVSVMEMDSVQILVGSDTTSVKATVEADELEYGGETESNKTYTPW